MVQSSTLTTGQRYIFVEGIDNFLMDLSHELRKSLGELCSDNRDVIWIPVDLPSDSKFGLKCLDRFPLVERELERKSLTSSTASLKDNKLSGAFRISSITLDSVTTTSHCSMPGILNIAFGHWESSKSPIEGQRSTEIHLVHASNDDIPRSQQVLERSKVGEKRHVRLSRRDMRELRSFRSTVGWG